MAISNPIVNIEIIPAFETALTEEQKILYVGQKTASGSAAANTLVQTIGNANEQNALFGAHSMLAAMVFAAKKYNKTTRMDALVLDDDGAAVAATGTIAFSGAATEAGTYTVFVGSKLDHAYTLTVADTDTATAVGAALEALITADATVPVTAANVTGTVTMTAVNKGLAGNDITLRIDGTIAGLGLTVTPMASGATDPDLSTIFALVDTLRYQTVIFPESYLLQTEATDFLKDRFNAPGDKILDGEGLAAVTDTHANLLTSTLAANLQSFTLIANRTVNEPLYKGSALLELNYVIASQLGAIRALRLTTGASLTRFVNASQTSKDAKGGIHMATFPYHNTPFVNLPLIDNEFMWSDTERTELKTAAWTIIGDNANNSEVIADSVITRYKTNAAAEPDESFKFLNYVDQSSTVREVFHNNLKITFANTRLTEGDLVAGFNMANSGVIKAEIMRIYSFLGDNVLVPTGENSRQAFLQKLIVAIDEISGTVTVTMLDPVLTQLREIDATMQLTFSLNS
jgi:phage tail sheath gpL-like